MTFHPDAGFSTYRARRRTGFTLVELVIVVVVLGILAAITIPRWFLMRSRALEAMVQADLRSMAASQEIYHLRNLTYGGSPEEVNALTSEGVTLTVVEAGPEGWSATGTHEGAAGRCALYYGDAAPLDPATAAGVVACDF